MNKEKTKPETQVSISEFEMNPSRYMKLAETQNIILMRGAVPVLVLLSIDEYTRLVHAAKGLEVVK